jgi:hypothetical protein
VDSIDRPLEVSVAEFPEGFEWGLVPPVDEISISDEDNIPFSKTICRVEVPVALDQIIRFISKEHPEDACDLGHGDLSEQLRIQNPQPIEYALMHFMGKLKNRPGEIRLGIVSGACRIEI